jgi:hypothetical protein
VLLSFDFASSLSPWPGSGLLGKPLKLAAPHCTAGFRVGLDLHWIDPPGNFCSFVNRLGSGSGRFRSRLAPPHCAAGFRVGLDLHWDCSFPGIFTSSSVCSPSFGLFAKPLELAAPHCAAGFRVRLNFHWRAPFVWVPYFFQLALLGNASRVPKVTTPFRWGNWRIPH